jgi:hypothetical protein
MQDTQFRDLIINGSKNRTQGKFSKPEVSEYYRILLKDKIMAMMWSAILAGNSKEGAATLAAEEIYFHGFTIS